MCEDLNRKILIARADKNSEKEKTLEEEKDSHLHNADAFHKFRAAAKELATDNPDHLVLCFDFQKNLPLPLTNVVSEYYLRQPLDWPLCIYIQSISRISARMKLFLASIFILKT